MRIDIDNFREIADSLTRNKSRSLLTGFGVFWGIFMLLFMLGGGQGFKKLISSVFNGFATNTCILVSSETSKPYGGFQEGRSWRLTYTDVERTRQMVPELETVTPVLIPASVRAVYDEYSSSGVIQGIAPDFVKIEEPNMKYGRYLNEADMQQKRKVCLIGRRIYSELFPDGGDPCGKFIKAGECYYQIVGVDYSSSQVCAGVQADVRISIPLPVAQQIYNRGDNVDMICVTGYPGVRMSELETQLREITARHHHFDPKDKKALTFVNAEEIFALIDNLFNGVGFLVWLVGLGSILAGVIGVSNIMMVTVKERTTEIGIRRAIGATPRNILSQVILESIALTLAAGSFGIVFATYALRFAEYVVEHSDEFPTTAFQISFGLAIASAVLLTLLGVIAGLAPAMRAMAIKPVDAMREE